MSFVPLCLCARSLEIGLCRYKGFEQELGDREKALKAAIKYCQEHEILREFLEQHATEVISMLMTEWNMDEALQVRFEEGIEKGIEKRDEEFVKNALAEGLSLELIHKITGLDMETIRNIQARQ